MHKNFIVQHKAAVSWKFSHCFFLWDFFLMHYAVIINYELFWKKFFPIKRKQRVNNCFKPLILSAFTTVASRLTSEWKDKEK